MSTSCRTRLSASLALCVLLGACGNAPADTVAPQHAAPSRSVHAPGPPQLLDWPEFGLNPQRSDASGLSTGITAANVAHLHHVSVTLPGTVDSSPIYLHGVSVAGMAHDTAIVTTTYGKTLALDANSGRVLWTFTPPGYSHRAGSYQITTTSPVADPDHRFVYAASPDGRIHKLSLSSGSEARGWPVSVTRDPTHEKLAAALNLSGRYVLATTGGYIGDAPPYQGHVVAIDRASGRVASVFNTLCASRHRVIVPSSCSSSDSAILSRGGAVVEPGGGRLLIDTGNGPWNGTTDFGDSVVELKLPNLRYRQSFAPANQAQLGESDTDLGSSAPALLGHDRVLVGGKDGVLRVLSLSRLDGHRPSSRRRLGGEVQRLPLPGGGMLFTQPAVLREGARTTVFVADENATAAFALTRGRLRVVWRNGTPGTSPIVAGGLLYVYDPAGGGVLVYRPSSSHPIARLAGGSGHWNSPIVADGHVIEPEGDANDHSLSGRLELFSAA
ncbi:MAG: outer membrane protein assembly factor BamB family protein [Solirubrobacteraceae bacterium]